MSGDEGVGIVMLLLLAALATAPVLRWLPEPLEDPDIAAKPPYHQLATRGFVGATVIAVGAAAALAGWRGDLWLWLPVVSVCALAVTIDARTTYLPLRLAQAAWVLLPVGVAWHAWATGDPWTWARAGVGGLVAGTLMLVAWRFAGVGFGDVRLMGVLGAVAAAQGWSLLLPALLVGTLLGAVWGVAGRIRGSAGHFPYGPGLWAGAVLSLLWA